MVNRPIVYVKVLSRMAHKFPGRSLPHQIRRVETRLTAILRARIDELQKWLKKNFLIINSSLYIAGPKGKTLRNLENSEFLDADLIKIWYRFPRLTFRAGIQVMSAFPAGRLGNRFFELSLLMAFGEKLSDRFPIMLHKQLQGDEALIAPFLRNAPVFSFETNKKSLRIQNSVQSSHGPVIIQINFLDLWPKDALETNLLSSSFEILRSRSSARLRSLAGEDSVVIHFRGTDRLSSRQDPQFGPAPLSFFVKAARHSSASESLIVTDDPDSQLLADLVERLRVAGISTKVQSRSLHEDFGALLSGRKLILSGSSLGDSAAGLSDCLQSAYIFQRVLPTRSNHGAEVIEMYDRSGLWDDGLDRIQGSFQEGIGHLMRKIPESEIHPRTR